VRVTPGNGHCRIRDGAAGVRDDDLELESVALVNPNRGRMRISAVPTDDPCGSWCQTTCNDPLASRSSPTRSMFAPVGAVTGSQ
jgi:hypothetical protein